VEVDDVSEQHAAWAMILFGNQTDMRIQMQVMDYSLWADCLPVCRPVQ